MTPRNQRLKILHVILAITETNGQYNEHCLPLMQERDISICTYFRPQMTPPPQITLFGGDSTVPGFFRALDTALDARHYDVIHAHVPHSGVLLIAANLGRRGILERCVYSVLNSYQNYKLRNRMMHYPIFAAFPQIVFCSHSCYESFPAPLKRLAGSRWHMAPNTVDINRIDQVLAKTPRTPPDHAFAVVSVGRLIQIKNPLNVLDAFVAGAEPDATLVYVGEGNWRQRLQAHANTVGIQNRVQITGLVPRDDVFRHVADSDVFVSASRGEGLPVAVLEAMACRCPVILSDIPPHRELADGADYIPLLNPDDVAGFAQEIARLRRMPVAERRDLGELCRRHVEQRYGLPIMHSQLDKVYAEVTHKRHIASQQQIA